jgi:hypothetical protein
MQQEAGRPCAHTPGPWTVDNGVNIIRNGTQPTGLFQVASCHDFTTRQIDGSREEREANARLIAAAPELLAQCKEFVRLLQDVPRPADTVLAAKLGKAFVEGMTAIAKAEGRA